MLKHHMRYPHHSIVPIALQEAVGKRVWVKLEAELPASKRSVRRELVREQQEVVYE